MFGLTPQQLGAIGLGLAAALVYGYQNRAAIAGGLGGAFAWLTGGESKPDRKAILALLDDAYAYFDSEAVNCSEGKAAIRTAISHVHAEHPHP